MGEEPDPQSAEGFGETPRPVDDWTVEPPYASRQEYTRWATPADDLDPLDPSSLDTEGGDPDAVAPIVPSQYPPRAPTAALGWTAVCIALFCVIADVAAVTLAVERYWAPATLIAQACTLATAVAFVIGLFAAWRTPGRWLGIGAMVLAVLANPFILTRLLTFLGGS